MSEFNALLRQIKESCSGEDHAEAAITVCDTAALANAWLKDSFQQHKASDCLILTKMILNELDRIEDNEVPESPRSSGAS